MAKRKRRGIVRALWRLRGVLRHWRGPNHWDLYPVPKWKELNAAIDLVTNDGRIHDGGYVVLVTRQEMLQAQEILEVWLKNC